MSLLPFVHVDEPLTGRRAGDDVDLSPEDAHRLRTVLRLRQGAGVLVSDGVGGRADASLTAAAVLRLTTDAVRYPRMHPEIDVIQSLGKGRKTEEVVQAVTELGVDGITLVAAARSIVRVDPAKLSRMRDRWIAVSRAACEQSRRVHRPNIHGPVTTAEVPDRDGALFVAHVGGQPLPEAIGAVAPTGRVTIAVGPEGGWTAGELAGWRARGGHLVGLGPTVLRMEHAAAAAVAVAAAVLGRWSGPAEPDSPPAPPPGVRDPA